MASVSNGSNERDEEKDIVPFDDVTKNTAPAIPAEEPHDFPDGGIRAWSVVLGTYHLIIGGGTVLVVCLFMLSLAQPEHFYQFFLAHGMGVGIATGMAHVPSMAVVSHYFHRRRAVAMGIASTGSALGGALHPIMLNKLFYGRAGFHGGVRASAGMCLALYVIGLRQIAILNGTNAFGRFLPNMIVHRAGILNVIIICEFIASLLVFCTLGVKTASGTIVFTIFYGFFSGAFLGLLAPMIASSATNQAEIGARMGICLAFTDGRDVPRMYPNKLYLNRLTPAQYLPTHVLNKPIIIKVLTTKKQSTMSRNLIGGAGKGYIFPSFPSSQYLSQSVWKDNKVPPLLSVTT
ncbi:hypothetical protein H0H93_006904 [Arthromyces matolae]|nr:hypothetical protein H0H93_006904 [Arthromyces matolae]